MSVEARNIIVEALNSVPERHAWGIVMYIYQTPEGKIEYEFCGSYIEFDENTRKLITHEISGFTMDDINAGLEMLGAEEVFSRCFEVHYGTHSEYNTPCIRIGKKL